MTDRSDVEDRLCEITGRRYAILTGRGATAVFLAMSALEPSRKVLAVPGNLCYAAICPVLYAGYRLRLVDINLEDYNVDLQDLERVLAAGVGALMVHHAYGHAAPMRQVAELCARLRVGLVEDAAVGFGGTADSRPVGSWGDFSILSFGQAKTLDAGGGGALLTDDPALYHRATALYEELPHAGQETERAEHEVVAIVRVLWGLRNGSPQIKDLFDALWPLYRDAFLYRFPEGLAPTIAEGLEGLENVVRTRQQSAAEYESGLAHPAVARPTVPPGSVVWRYTFLVPAAVREPLVGALRAEGIHASALYPNAEDQFSCYSEPTLGLPNCRRLDASAVNLWVRPATDGQMVERGIQLTLRTLDQMQEGGPRGGD